MTNFNLSRFVEAQENDYATALREINNGQKVNHWIWYIFPQLKGLGKSWMSEYYGLDGVEEAKAYLDHPVLGTRLREITSALLQHQGKRSVYQIMGSCIDVVKLKSSMTLFDGIAPNDVFAEVLKAYLSTQ